MTQEFTPDRTLSALYPEVAAGGFTRRDGFVEFFTRVNALLTPDSQVLDFGAGRGAWADEGQLSALHRDLRGFHTRVARVVGVDVDRAVMSNPHLDEAHVVTPGATLPFADSAFDLVVADHVLEHVDHADAATTAAEITRVLRPGGWLAARTPYKWGMIALGARAVPNDLHTRVLRRLQPGRQERDVFPTRYAMNTRRALRTLFPAATHDHAVYNHTSEPTYFGSSHLAWRLASAAGRLTPPPLEATLMVFIRKR